jgi:hypothetical protein
MIPIHFLSDCQHFLLLTISFRYPFFFFFQRVCQFRFGFGFTFSISCTVLGQASRDGRLRLYMRTGMAFLIAFFFLQFVFCSTFTRETSVLAFCHWTGVVYIRLGGVVSPSYAQEGKSDIVVLRNLHSTWIIFRPADSKSVEATQWLYKEKYISVKAKLLNCIAKHVRQLLIHIQKWCTQNRCKMHK